MKKKYMEDSDEENEFDVDEPEAIQNNASDDDWTPEVENNQGRRQSTRLRNTPRLRSSIIDASSSDDASDDDDDDDDTNKRKSKVKTSGKGRGRPIKRVKVSSTSSPSSPTSLSEKSVDAAKPVTTSDSEPTSTTAPAGGNNVPLKISKDYSSGSFVVSKVDFNNSVDEPPIWKIDGKALLQKYIPFTQDGKTLYKNTSVYSGWTPNNRDNYYPITVTFKQQTRKEHIVEFLKDQVKVDETTHE